MASTQILLEDSTTQKFRVAKFSFCQNEECTFSDFSDNLHLVVSTEHVELKRGNAIALSYTWGEFNRKNISIGHRSDGTTVQLELGEEWILGDIVARLAMLCMEYGFCWMDQLCIPQKDEEIRAALASIPSIYQTLDVIAFLPGSVCACADKVFGMAKSATDAIIESGSMEKTAIEQIQLVQRRIRLEIVKCLNSSGLCSWFSRLWTRQELLYAQRVRVLWASDQAAQCVSNPIGIDMSSTERPDEINDTVMDHQPVLEDEEVEKLAPYSALLYKHRLAEGDSPSAALTKLFREQIRFNQRGISSLGEFLETDREDRQHDQRAFMTFLRFLCGMMIEKDVTYARGDPQRRLRAFFAQLGQLGSLQRAATQQRDYVVAVWVDCPEYVLPVKFRSMSLSELLEDALSQIEHKFHVSLAVYAPGGLFGAQRRQGMWQPSHYLQHIETASSRDVYGVLPHRRNRPIPLNEQGMVSLQYLGPGAIAKSRVSSEYRAQFQGETTDFVLKMLKRVVECWPGDVQERITFSRKDYSIIDRESDYFSRALFFHLDGNKPTNADDPEDVESPQKIHPSNLKAALEATLVSEDEHYQATYSLVADALGLDISVCQSLGLQLVIRITEGKMAPFIGLSTVDLGYSKEPFDIDEYHDDFEVGTVCMLRGSFFQGSCLFEVQRVPGEEDPPQFIVTGVWVPHKDVYFNDISAIPAANASDGVIL